MKRAGRMFKVRNIGEFLFFGFLVFILGYDDG